MRLEWLTKPIKTHFCELCLFLLLLKRHTRLIEAHIVGADCIVRVLMLSGIIFPSAHRADFVKVLHSNGFLPAARARMLSGHLDRLSLMFSGRASSGS